MYKLCFCSIILSMVNVLGCAQDRVVMLNTTNDLNVIRKKLFLMLESSYNSIEIMNKELHDLNVTVKKLSMISTEIKGNSFCLNMTRRIRVIYEKNDVIMFFKMYLN